MTSCQGATGSAAWLSAALSSGGHFPHRQTKSAAGLTRLHVSNDSLDMMRHPLVLKIGTNQAQSRSEFLCLNISRQLPLRIVTTGTGRPTHDLIRGRSEHAQPDRMASPYAHNMRSALFGRRRRFRRTVCRRIAKSACRRATLSGTRLGRSGRWPRPRRNAASCTAWPRAAARQTRAGAARTATEDVKQRQPGPGFIGERPSAPTLGGEKSTAHSSCRMAH